VDAHTALALQGLNGYGFLREGIHMNAFSAILTTIVAALLIWGAVTDVRTARIPNKLVLAGLLLAPAVGLAQGGLAGLGAALAAAGIALAIGFAGFALGAIGGGDAKFLMVGAALVGLPQMVPYLLAAGALGGLLAIGTIAWQRRGLEATVMTLDLAKSAATLGRKGYRGRVGDEGRMAVPYGVAIAAGALIVQFTPFAGWLSG
jgi:prepilin peptidase CpaA